MKSFASPFFTQRRRGPSLSSPLFPLRHWTALALSITPSSILRRRSCPCPGCRFVRALIQHPELTFGYCAFPATPHTHIHTSFQIKPGEIFSAIKSLSETKSAFFLLPYLLLKLVSRMESVKAYQWLWVLTETCLCVRDWIQITECTASETMATVCISGVSTVFLDASIIYMCDIDLLCPLQTFF